ncbi:MAG: septum formation initiator family protein [Cardiobacteriaceae bacterium]|nr:septum formation initiator family protein [Cardiobacteriaceae bacterium]
MKKSLVYLALVIIVAVLGFLNYRLWHVQASKKERIEGLQTQVALHQRENHGLTDRNEALRVEVENLRSPDSHYSYEEKAREDYGMIGKNETYFVLPASELAGIPAVEGLLAKADNGSTMREAPMHLPANTLSLESVDGVENIDAAPVVVPRQTDDPIPVTPVPLQLESLQ